jgi:hypothetical protein
VRLVRAAALLSRWTDPRLFPASGDYGKDDGRNELLLRKMLHVAVEGGAGTMSEQEWQSSTRVLRRSIRQLGLRKALEVSTQCVTLLGEEERNQLNRDGCACVDRDFHWIVDNTVRPSGYADQIQLHLWIYSVMRRFFWVGVLLPIVELALSQAVPHCRQPLTLWLVVDGFVWLATAGAMLLTYSAVSTITNQALCRFAGESSPSAGSEGQEADSEKPRSQLEGLTGCSGQTLCRLLVTLGLLVLCLVVGAVGGFVATGLLVVTFMQGHGCAPFTLVVTSSFLFWRHSCSIAWACVLYRDLRTLWCAKREYDRMPPKKYATRPRSPHPREGGAQGQAGESMFPAPASSKVLAESPPASASMANRKERPPPASSAGRDPGASTSLLSAKSSDCEYGACPPLEKDRRASP